MSFILLELCDGGREVQTFEHPHAISLLAHVLLSCRRMQLFAMRGGIPVSQIRGRIRPMQSFWSCDGQVPGCVGEISLSCASSDNERALTLVMIRAEQDAKDHHVSSAPPALGWERQDVALGDVRRRLIGWTGGDQAIGSALCYAAAVNPDHPFWSPPIQTIGSGKRMSRSAGRGLK